MPAPDDEDILDPEQLGRSKEEKGRFTLTPAERKLARQTAAADRKLNQDDAARLTEPENHSLASRREGPSPVQAYARGGKVPAAPPLGLSKGTFAEGGPEMPRSGTPGNKRKR